MDAETRTALEAERLFGAALREVRRRYGVETGQAPLTMKRFARMLGISGERPEERYRLYESAERQPPMWILAALRRVTGYSLDAMIAQLPAGRPLDTISATTPRRRARPQPKERPPSRPPPGGHERRASDRASPHGNGAGRRAGD